MAKIPSRWIGREIFKKQNPMLPKVTKTYSLALTAIFIFLTSFLYGQSELTTILQTTLNLKILNDHIEKNDIIDEREIKYIKTDPKIPTHTQLTFQDKKLEFNDGKGEDGFFNHWSFEFTKISVKRKKASVSYNFIPHWKNCTGKFQILQSDKLFFKLKIDLQKIQGQWIIRNHEIIDVPIEDAKIAECVRVRYKKL